MDFAVRRLQPTAAITGDDLIISVLTTAALIIIGVLLFNLIIFVHEFGHFITAKKFGVKVNEFSIGMGKRIFGFKKGETEYSLRLIPVGGYCAMEGEDEVAGNPGRSKKKEPDGSDVEDSDDPGEDAEYSDYPDAGAVSADTDEVAGSDPRSFNNAKIWKRMIIIVAGAVMNILLGVVLMFFTMLPKQNFVSNDISLFAPCSFSAVTGLKPGDKIVSINNYAVSTSTDFSFAMYTLPVVEVDGGELSIYKEDCVFDLYRFAVENITEDTPQDVNVELGTLMREAQEKLADAADTDAAYSIFREYCDIFAEKLTVELEGYPEIEYRETRMRFRTDMTVIRDGEKITLNDVDFLTLKTSEDGDPQLNIDFYVEPIEKNLGTTITQTLKETVSTVRMVWASLAGLVTGKFSLNDMSGPIGMASAITDVASETLKTSGFGSAVSSIVYIMMVIAINLGVVNMLPFPALDGGRFILLLIEAIFRKPIPRKIESVINAVGLVLLLGLSAVIAVKDVIKIVLGG